MDDYDGELGVYFAVTCSRENLRGLEPYLRMEALVKRLLPDRGNEEFDVERSDSLLNKVYRYRSIFNPSVYKNVNAKRLVSNYVAAYFYLGLAHKRNGDLARAIKALEAADRFGRDRLLPVEYWLSYLYTENGELDKAEARLLRAVSNNDSITELPNNLEVIEGDIRSYHIVREAVDGVDFILHQAALPSVPRSIKDPITTNEVNVVGILNILEAAKNAKVKRVVYASSSSVYGNSEILPKKEDMNPEPISPYAVSKLAGEKYCKVFCEVYGLLG